MEYGLGRCPPEAGLTALREIHVHTARPLVAALVVAIAVLLLQARESQPALAVHHIADINEVMSGFNGDPNVQYVRISRLALYQGEVANTRLTAFKPDGTLAGVLLDPLGSDVGYLVGNWIMGTAAFEAAAGISADFVFAPGILPAAGMVCWGAPGESAPPDPSTWDASDPNNYVDCVSYGGASFTGTNPMSPNPHAAGAGDDTLSLTRSVSSTGKLTNPWRNSDDATDFKLATPSPRNDAGQTGTLAKPGPTPTPTITPTPAPVGGVSLDGGLRALSGDSGGSLWLTGWLLAAALAGTVALCSTAWAAVRRRQG